MPANPIEDPAFFSLLLKIDRATADELRQKGCPECGGPLHWANYARSPRGVPSECGTEHLTRLSLCCGREGCRKRLTPPSVRFRPKGLCRRSSGSVFGHGPPAIPPHLTVDDFSFRLYKNFVAQQLFHRPPMVRQPGRHGRSPFDPFSGSHYRCCNTQ